jgi:hypothetical protein
MSLFLNFKTSTWQKDSHSLFDYESPKIVVDTFEMALLEKQRIGIFRKKDCNGFVTQHPKSSSRRRPGWRRRPGTLTTCSP